MNRKGAKQCSPATTNGHTATTITVLSVQGYAESSQVKEAESWKENPRHCITLAENIKGGENPAREFARNRDAVQCLPTTTKRSSADRTHNSFNGATANPATVKHIRFIVAGICIF